MTESTDVHGTSAGLGEGPGEAFQPGPGGVPRESGCGMQRPRVAGAQRGRGDAEGSTGRDTEERDRPVRRPAGLLSHWLREARRWEQPRWPNVAEPPALSALTCHRTLVTTPGWVRRILSPILQMSRVRHRETVSHAQEAGPGLRDSRLTFFSPVHEGRVSRRRGQAGRIKQTEQTPISTPVAAVPRRQLEPSFCAQ